MTEREIVTELRNKRLELELTQRDVAEALKIPQSTMYRLENFKSSPQLHTVLRYAEYVGLRLLLLEDSIFSRRSSYKLGLGNKK